MKPILGVDFDNTIVCYDDVFHTVAVERDLIAKDFPQNKEKIRNYLRQKNQEDAWTLMQGYVYGHRMEEAKPFPGMVEFFKTAIEKQIDIYIISHKTHHPFLGPQYDLHDAAYKWLKKNNFFAKKYIGLDTNHVFFCETKQEKCQKISDMRCTHFIDDLPEFLFDQSFPNSTQRMLFSPQIQLNNQETTMATSLLKFNSWDQIHRHIFIE